MVCTSNHRISAQRALTVLSRSRAGKAAEGGGHELKELDRDREANVVTAAIAALAAAAGVLAWPHYQQLLGRFMRIMGRDASKARAMSCALLAARSLWHAD